MFFCYVWGCYCMRGLNALNAALLTNILYKTIGSIYTRGGANVNSSLL